ncbi:DUF2059 domain-containing protein [Cellvibrio sp. KY-GH-1]|uniref:DUF2059 domain-containing protein n=1 Tax=Cellvibrio sp. KY-GH-1 TaxID=2303332 RepID=UPI001246CA70|nr:DUF2059 domain-containing protein [Cellvibrio sp. KY-GH-1]QEY18395.1 DUF2059 domain-containing protein [Cellvibrio sp. KY-GH-1]
MLRSIVLLVVGALLAFNVHAKDVDSDKASKESIEKLLVITDAGKMVDSMYAQIEVVFSNMATQLGVTEKDKPTFDKYMKKLMQLMSTEMSWEKMKAPTIEIYAKHFTESEIQGLITFYNSEVGRSTIKKMPLVMQDSMLLGQQMMQSVFPKIKELSDELGAEIKASREKNKK